LLGLWLEFILRRNNFQIKFIALIATTVLLAYNLFFCLLIFRNYSRNIPGNMIDGTMNQTKEIAEYIISEVGSRKKIQIDGQGIYLDRFANRISYFLADSKIEIITPNKYVKLDNNLPIFVVVNESSEEFYPGMVYKKYGEIEKNHRIYDVTILKMKNAPK